MHGIKTVIWFSAAFGLSAAAALHEPEHGVYLGVYFPIENAQNITDFTLHAGKQHAVYAAFVATDDAFPWDWATCVTSVYPAAALHIAYEPMNGFDDTFSNWVAGGAVYDRMYSFATNCALFGGPIFLRFAHEANGTWYPWAPGYSDSDSVTTQTYIEGWRNVATLFHTVASNVAMVWAPTQGTSGSNSPMNDYAAVYPGDDWVDWVGLSVYNGNYYGNNDSVMDFQFRKALELGYYADIPTDQNFYDTFSNPDNTNGHRKPMMIAETASVFEPAYICTNETVVAALDSLTGGNGSGEQLIEGFESANGMWPTWDKLAIFSSGDAHSGTGAIQLTASDLCSDGWYVGGTGTGICNMANWSSVTSVYIYAKREADNAVDPVLKIGLRSRYGTEERTGMWARVLSSTNYMRFELPRSELSGESLNLDWTAITALSLEIVTTLSNDVPANILVDDFGYLISSAPDQVWWTGGGAPWGISTWELTPDAVRGSSALRIGGADTNNSYGYIGGNGCSLSGKKDWSDCDGLAFYAKRGTNFTTKPWLRIELDSDYMEANGTEASLEFSLQNTAYSHVIIPFSLFNCCTGFTLSNICQIKLHLLTHTYGIQPADVYLDDLRVGQYIATNAADAVKNQQDWMRQLFALCDYDGDESDTEPDYVDVSRCFKNLHMINWFHQDMIEDGRYVDFRIFNENGSEPAYETYSRLIASSYYLSQVVTDRNGNGMDDNWEITHFGETGVDPDEDADNDGMSNVNEYRTGTIPTNAESVFRLVFAAPVAPGDDELRLAWPGRDGLFYRLERTASLSEPFIVITNGIKGVAPENMFIETPEESVTHMFYRITQE